MSKKKNKNLIILVLLALVVVAVAIFFLQSKTSSDTSSQANASDDLFAVESDDLVKGNPDAKVVVIEYADFQCPACQSMYQRWNLVWRLLKKDMLLVYRHYPLSQHQHARNASVYSEAANRQGKFWEFHDLVYENQDSWMSLSQKEANLLFESFAMGIGLDMDQFKKDITSSEIQDKIDRDMERANKSGLRGTPTLFLNGEKFNVPANLSEFVSLIKNYNQNSQ